VVAIQADTNRTLLACNARSRTENARSAQETTDQIAKGSGTSHLTARAQSQENTETSLTCDDGEAGYVRLLGFFYNIFLSK
jgi:hypothetical protein